MECRQKVQQDTYHFQRGVTLLPTTSGIRIPVSTAGCAIAVAFAAAGAFHRETNLLGRLGATRSGIRSLYVQRDTKPRFVSGSSKSCIANRNAESFNGSTENCVTGSGGHRATQH
jgi:hypothetical protein